MTLQPLLDRLEAATRPSFALDMEIALTLVPDIIVMRQRQDDSGADPYTYRKFTANVDDAMWLAVLLLDDGAIDIETAHRSVGGLPHGRAEICSPRVDVYVKAPTPALALCIATLRALIDLPALSKQSQESRP